MLSRVKNIIMIIKKNSEKFRLLSNEYYKKIKINDWSTVKVI